MEGVELIDYNSVTSVSAEEFETLMPDAAELTDSSRFTESDPEDVAKIERLLDVKEGTLGDEAYYVERIECACGRIPTTYDLVVSGLVDAGHSKSVILHTFVGNERIVNPPRPIRCSLCARIHPAHKYLMPSGYTCQMR